MKFFISNFFSEAFKVEGEDNDYDEKNTESLEGEVKTHKNEKTSSSFHQNRSIKVLFKQKNNPFYQF